MKRGAAQASVTLKKKAAVKTRNNLCRRKLNFRGTAREGACILDGLGWQPTLHSGRLHEKVTLKLIHTNKISHHSETKLRCYCYFATNDREFFSWRIILSKSTSALWLLTWRSASALSGRKRSARSGTRWGNFLTNKFFALNVRSFNDPINQWAAGTVDWRPWEGRGLGRLAPV